MMNNHRCFKAIFIILNVAHAFTSIGASAKLLQILKVVVPYIIKFQGEFRYTSDCLKLKFGHIAMHLQLYITL